MTSQKVTLQNDTLGFDDTDLAHLSDTPIAIHYLAAFLLTAFATALAVGFDSKVAIPNLSLIYVIPVVVIAVAFDIGSSLFSAVLGALFYNFFLTEPRYTLQVDDPANIWAIGLLFVVGCIASAIASTARRRADDVIRMREQASTLQAYSHDIAAANDSRSILSITAGVLEALFRVPVVVIVISENSVKSVERRGDTEPVTEEAKAAQHSLVNNKWVPAGVYPFENSRFDFWPVRTLEGQQAVIGLLFGPDERPTRPGTIVETVASLLSLALDRIHLRRVEGRI